jgi:hypothetical protein
LATTAIMTLLASHVYPCIRARCASPGC